jgi:tetratricopeptide (TPR) repeat protein
LYDQQGRAEEAVSLYDRALKIKPDYSEAHLNYAIILERLGYLEEARKHYQRFLFQPPSDLGDVVASVQARLPNLPN